MRVECFLDTNVLVYAVSSAEEDAARRERALDLVTRADFGLSAQVLQEFYVTVTRKIRKLLAPDLYEGEERKMLLERGRGGHIVEMKPAEEIYANPEHPYTRKLMAAIPKGEIVD